VKKALVSGNYRKSTGLGYGGVKLSKSAKNVIELLQNEKIGLIKSDAPGSLVMIDVHTGLGPSGEYALSSRLLS
jgi:hypothetical protein